jgi:hypothetical protein
MHARAGAVGVVRVNECSVIMSCTFNDLGPFVLGNSLVNGCAVGAQMCARMGSLIASNAITMQVIDYQSG